VSEACKDPCWIRLELLKRCEDATTSRAERDATLDRAIVRAEAAERERDALKVVLVQAVLRLGQYTGMCRCPGMTCVEACNECDKTQGLVNRGHAALAALSSWDVTDTDGLVFE